MKPNQKKATDLIAAPSASRHEVARSGTDTNDGCEPAVGDEKLFEMLVLGASVDTAAFAAGMSRRTAFRRLAEPVFRQRLEGARAAIRDSVVQRLTDATCTAIERLWELTEHEDEHVKMKACGILLDALPKVHDVMLRHSDKVTESYSVRQTGEDGERQVVAAVTTKASRG